MSTPRVVLPKKQHRIVADTIERWQALGTIDPATAGRLNASLEVQHFDWQKTARYSFIVAIICIVIAAGAIVADRVLMSLLARFFNAPAALKCAVFALLAAGMFWAGLKVRDRNPHRFYTSEAIFFLGVLALAAAVAFLGVALDTGSGHYSILFGIAAGLYLVLGFLFPSKLVWVFGLLALGSWMGTETGYLSGRGAYFLGMNYPLRFVIFGGLMVFAGVMGESRHLRLSTQTKVMGLLYLFIALWIMSIFGNLDDIERWHRASRFELLHWSVAFALVAVAAIVYGLRHDDGILRGFGLTFLFINLYTKYFEWFWDSMHKAIFFAVLALSFWYVGSRAEKIWHLGRGRMPA